MNAQKLAKYITIARRTINPTAPLIVNNNAFYYRNRLVDCATRCYVEHEYGRYRDVFYNHAHPQLRKAEPTKVWREGNTDQKQWAILKRKFRNAIPLNTTSLYGCKEIV